MASSGGIIFVVDVLLQAGDQVDEFEFLGLQFLCTSLGDVFGLSLVLVYLKEV
jgi:hypothetical protein